VNCEAKSHRTQKVNLAVGNLYILGTRKDRALLQPSLEVSLLPDDKDAAILAATSKPINVWKAFFESQTERIILSPTSDTQSEASWEDLESPSLDKLSSVTSSYVTSKKLKVGFLLEALDSEDLNLLLNYPRQALLNYQK
jgi:hypothetical protein